MLMSARCIRPLWPMGAFIERVDHIAEQTASIFYMTNAQASELVKTMGDLLD